MTTTPQDEWTEYNRKEWYNTGPEPMDTWVRICNRIMLEYNIDLYNASIIGIVRGKDH